MLSLFRKKTTVTVVDVKSYIDGIRKIHKQLQAVDFFDEADFSEYEAAMKVCLIMLLAEEEVSTIFKALLLAAKALQDV